MWQSLLDPEFAFHPYPQLIGCTVEYYIASYLLDLMVGEAGNK